MLVLSRKTDESIVLRTNGEVIAKIIVVRTQSSVTRLGIEAGPEIEIIREEFLDNWKGIGKCQDT